MATPFLPPPTLPRHRRAGRWVTLLLACASVMPTQAQKSPPPPTREPAIAVEPGVSPGVSPGFAPSLAPRLVVPQAASPIELRQYRQEVTVVGQAVQMRLLLEFHNPNPRVLEGELQFPLHEGQIVSGFALDIDGQLRRAVPVAKARGLQVFEDTIRARVDPALLEATAGNQYKLRVYPLPANGSRTVVLDITQALPAGSASSLERPLLLPLGLAGGASQASLQVRLVGMTPAHLRASTQGLPPQALHLQADGPDTLLQVAPMALSRPASVSLLLRPPADAAIQAAHFDGQDFVYAELPAPGGVATRPAPKRLALVWDASGSSAQRNLAQELALLDALFARWQTLSVNLFILRDRLEAPQTFPVQRGQWRALRERLQAEPADGATQLGAVQLTRQAGDLALLFTDGQSTFGPRRSPGVDIPTFVVQSALGSDGALLRQVVETGGGAVLDLQRWRIDQAAQRINQVLPRLVELRSAQGQQWVAASRQAEHGRIAVAGIAHQASGTLEADFQLPNLAMTTLKLHWGTTPRRPAPARSTRLDETDAGPPLAALRWAALSMASLTFQPEAHRAEVQRLGQRFGLATPETSLIVLDTLVDYVRHHIEPPAGPLRTAYRSQLTTADAGTQQQQQAHLDQLVRRFQDKQAWWATEFPKDAPPAPREAQPAVSGAIGAIGETQRSRASLADNRAAPAPLPVPSPVAAAAAPAAPPALAESRPAAKREGVAGPAGRQALAKAVGADDGTAGRAESAPASIQLRAWTPDAPYARRLRAAAPQTRYAVYLDERPNQLNSTAFFLDAADLFFAQGDPALGLRVLSNLAEMALENRALLRLLGYRLLQAGQPALAVPVFERVRELAPHEPQSSRDLGLALADAGQWQAGADALWHTASTRWAGGRFPDIDLTALAELNALIARAQRSGQPVNTAAMDARLLVNLPLGLRVVMGWDADNTDIDLYVRDPDGEEASYGRPRTRQGGRMSADFTGGYGPEEFSLRKPKPGLYTVRARFYGHRQQVLAPATTLMLRLATGFGTAAEKEQRVMLRLSGAGEVVTVGEFRVEASPE